MLSFHLSLSLYLLLNSHTFSGALQRKKSIPKYIVFQRKVKKKKKTCLVENVKTFTIPVRPAKENWQECLQATASFNGSAHSAGSFMWHHYSWNLFFFFFLQRGDSMLYEKNKINCTTEQGNTDLNFLLKSPGGQIS